MSAELPAVSDDDLANWLADLIVCGERLADVVVLSKEVGESLCVTSCFRHTEPHMRTCVGCGIPDERHATRHNARCDKVIDRREEWLPNSAQAVVQDGRQHVVTLVPQRGDQVFADKWRRYRIGVLMAMGVNAHLL